MNKYKFLFIPLLLFTANCNSLKVRLQSTLSFDCSILEKILNHPDINRILSLDRNKLHRAQVRVFYLNSNLKDCNGYAGDWSYQTYNKTSPSVNTGFNRDVFFEVKKVKESTQYKIYAASFENYLNRQTTYILTFLNEKLPTSDTIKLIGFGEYTDYGETIK